MGETRFDLSAANAETRIRLVAALRGKGAHLSFDDAIHDFPADIMNEKPNNVPYSFWHQLEHIRITQWDILKYIADPNHRSPEWPAGYWPAQSARADGAAWQKTLKQYHADLNALVALVEDPAAELLAPVAHMENRSIMRSTMIIVDHTAYHLGEFVMARQILGYWKSELSS
ncbi:MAG TPA: DinB family protein [Spirochaetia bacterium]|nr:DinB family protein [Spirochaetia bacterium]